MDTGERDCTLTDNIDHGPKPYVVDIDKATLENMNYRTALWTGNHLQLTLMSIPVGGEIGLENHSDVEQFLRVESGVGLVEMGRRRERLRYRNEVRDGYAIFVPEDTWHNVINTGDTPLKIYAIYAPPEHPHGTIDRTKADADASEEEEWYPCW